MTQLSEDQAKKILNSPDAYRTYRSLILLQDDALIARIKKKNTLALPIKNMMELVGGLLELWWIIVSVATISTALTVAAAGVFNLVGIGYAIYTYQKQTKEQKLVESYQFELLQRDAVRRLYPNAVITHKPAKPFEVSITGLCSVIFGMSSLVFFTYFYGLSSIMTSLGFVSAGLAMTGPIGMLIAGVIGIGFGLYYGHRYYDDKKCKYDLKTEIKNTIDERQQTLLLALDSSKREYQQQMGMLKKLDRGAEALNCVKVAANSSQAFDFFTSANPPESQQPQPIDDARICQS